jgi:hypothetical protein
MAEIQVAVERPAFELNHDEYKKVSISARLREIRLIASNYLVRPEAFQVAQDVDTMKNGFHGKCTDFIFDNDEGLAWGRFQWSVEIKSGRKSCLKLMAEYLVLYSDIFDCDGEHVEIYFRKVGRFATYPYFRAHFNHHIGETGIMLPPLPALNERVD